MNADLPSTDPIISQFRISPDLMPKMSTPTMAPNYTSIRKFQLALEENALSIQSHQSELGHLALVITDEAYLEANNDVAFVAPTDPGLVPPIQQKEFRHEHLPNMNLPCSRTPLRQPCEPSISHNKSSSVTKLLKLHCET